MFPNLPTEAPPSLSSAQSRRSSCAHLPCHWNWMRGPSCPKMWTAEDRFKFPPNSIFCVVELFVGVSKGVFLREVGVLRLGQWGADTVACVQCWGVALCVRVCLPIRTDPGSGVNTAGTNSRLRSEPAGKPASPCRLTLLLSLAVKEDSPTKRAVEEREVTISCGIQRTDGLKQNQLDW